MNSPAHWLRCARACLVLVMATAALAEDPLPALQERVILRHGAELLGQSLEISQGQLLWQFADGELLTIPLEEIERLDFELPPMPDTNSDSVDVPPSPTLTDPAEVLGEQPAPIVVPLLPQIQQTYDVASDTAARWTQRLQLGGVANDGNTRTAVVDLAGVFEQNTKEKMRQVDIGGQWGRNATTQTANRWWLNSNFDWPVYQKWITFVASKNEYNQPANLNYRGTVSTGIGYRFVYEDKKRLIVRFGPAYTLEIFRSPSNSRDTPDMFGEIEVRWPLVERTTLEQKTRVQPSVLDTELVRVFSTTGLVVDLDEKERWKFRLGLQYQYNSQPNQGKVPSDYLTTVSLVYQRK